MQYNNQQQNSQEQQTQQNEPRQQEELKIPEDSKDQEKPKQQDTSNHSDHPRNVEIQKRSSDSKVIFMSKTGSVITSKKDDTTSPKPLNIVTPNKDSTQSLPLSSQIHSSYSESSVPKVEKRNKDKDNQLDLGFTLDVIPVGILKNNKNKLTDARLPKSRGYIILQNYLLEMNNDKSGKSQFGHFNPQRSKSKQNIANLIDGYLPSIMYKNVNI